MSATTTLNEEIDSIIFSRIDITRNGDRFEWMTSRGSDFDASSSTTYRTRDDAVRAAIGYVRRNHPSMVAAAKEEALEGRAYRARHAA